MANTADNFQTRFPELRYCIASGLDTDDTHKVTIESNGKIILDHNFVAKERRKDYNFDNRVEGLQHANTPPSIEDVGRIFSLRSLLPNEIKKLEVQNHVLQASIGKLCHRLAENRSIINHKERELVLCNRMLSPIRRVPLEILHHIFLHCKSLPSGERKFNNSTKMPVGVVIGQVCRLWRQIAVSLPLLWNSVEVICGPRSTNLYSISPQSPPVTNPGPALLELCFRRSHPLPLTISIRSKCLLDPSLQPMHPSIVQSITSVAHRIEGLIIQAESKSSLEPLISSPPGTFPALKSLTLEISDFEDNQIPTTIFETCGLLRTLIMNIKPIHSSFTVRIPWGQLTHLDMLHGNQPIADSTWRIFIRLLHKLQDGRFCLAGRAPTQGFDVPFINNQPPMALSSTSHLTELHTLTIRFVGQELPQNRNIWLLRNLNLSAIRNFHFSFVRASTLPSFFFWKTENLQLPLLPYLQNLKSLTLWTVSISIPDLIDLLKMTVALERLRVKAAAKWTLAETRKLVNALMLKRPADGDGVNADGLDISHFAVAPSLTNLVVWADNLSKEQAQSYLTMVTTRRLAGEGGHKRFKMTLFCRQKLSNLPEGVIVVVKDSEAQSEPEMSGIACVGTSDLPRHA